MIAILSYHKAEYVEEIFKVLGRGRHHAGLAYAEWFRTGKFEGLGPAWGNAGALRDEMQDVTDWSLPEVRRSFVEGETRKFLVGEVETVALPMRAGWTLCVSSQVGCAMGCAFCETGRMGLKRNLDASEIVAQLFIARHEMGVPVRNVVFMGMGEPLDNYEAVMQAVGVMTEPCGLGLGPRNITISTCGRVEEIYRLIDDADPLLNLAVSVNAPDDRIRRKIMPINRTHDMSALYVAMKAYCAHPKRQILAEYVLLEGINDSVDDAKKLCGYLEGLDVKVNLIPYNPQADDWFAPPSWEAIDAFAAQVHARGVRVTVRGTKGQQIMAACGQLSTALV